MLKGSHIRFAVISLLVLALVIPITARAQDTSVRLSSLEVDLWPEYDRPSMLIIYKITLAPEVNLPASLTFRIPASAGSPHAVAALQVDTLVNVNYEERRVGDWNQVTFTATTPELWLEYYDPSLQKDGDSRHFSYVWPGDYAISSLIIDVQQPVNSQNMRISPSLGAGKVGSDGLTHFTSQVGSLEGGQSFELEITYDKQDDVLSAELIQVGPVEPLTDQTPGRLSSTFNIPTHFIWLGLIGALGLGLIVGGAIWYIRSGQKDTTPPPRRRRSPSKKPVTVEASASDEAVYCSQCGKRAAPGDRFCRACGSKLRSE